MMVHPGLILATCKLPLMSGVDVLIFLVGENYRQHTFAFFGTNAAPKYGFLYL
jgi:hypothetical protein